MKEEHAMTNAEKGRSGFALVQASFLEPCLG